MAVSSYTDRLCSKLVHYQVHDFHVWWYTSAAQTTSFNLKGDAVPAIVCAVSVRVLPHSQSLLVGQTVLPAYNGERE